MKLRTLLLALVFPLSALSPAAAASVDGINLHWTSTGSGPQTLVFIHGWTCDETSWSAQVPALSKKYRVLTLDLPGHGKSGLPKDGAFSMDLFARAVEAVRVEAKADRLVLVGHSMGTPVIRQYARLYPQRVAALVLVDGVMMLGAPRPGAPPGALPQPEQMRGPGGPKAREGMIRGMFVAGTSKPVQDHVLKMMLGAPEATAYGAMRATFDPAIWKESPVFTVPALGLFAEKSALGNPEATRKVLPNLEYHEIAGTGHFLMMEKPAEFNRLLERFVDALPAAAPQAGAGGVVKCAPVPQATLDANKQLLIDFFASGRLSREERSRRFQAPDYVQHNPRALRLDEFTGAKGSDAWVKAFDEAARRKVALVDLGGIALRDPIIVMAECDLVTAIYKGVLKDPDDPNRTYEAFAFETVRVKDGKFTEHWDQVTLAPGWLKGATAR